MNTYLNHYRVLDLTDHRGALAGHMLAQLGAEVVQIELPEGSSSRGQQPTDEHGCSYFWEAFASGKKSVVCDYRIQSGRDALIELVKKTDVLIESFNPGELDQYQLSYAELSTINPKLVMVSISAFGQSGPKAQYQATDLTIWAASGYLLLSRDGENPPVRFSIPQAFLHASADAVSGALIAIAERHQSGLGQHVDVSAQQAAALATLATSLAGKVGHPHFSVPGSIAPPKPGEKKQLDLSGSGSRTKRPKWQLQDGLAEMHLAIGPAAGRFANNMIAWVAEQGKIDQDIAQWDWTQLPDRIHADEVDEQDLERAKDQVAAFLSQFHKSELIPHAIERKLLLAPIMNTSDLLLSPHHQQRNFFQTCDGSSLQLPGDFAMTTADTGFRGLSRAPDLGEHNAEVLQQWVNDSNAGQTTENREPQSSSEPLANLKVLDLAWVVAGPVIGRTLADFGAQVIRVESSKRVETARLMGPFPGGKPDPQKSALFDNCNAGKLGLTLNMGTDEGKAIIRDLVAWADVVIESFSPGQMENWGLGYSTLKAINPGIVMLSTSLMGQSGPYQRFSGFGNVGAAVSGFQGLVGWPGQQPIGPFGPYSDFVGPRFATAVLLSALEHRRKTGEGAWLDVAQAEAGIQFLAPYIAHTSATGQTPQLSGNRDPMMSPNGVFPCLPNSDEAESWIAISVENEQQWHALATAMEQPDLVQNPKFSSLENRQANESELESLIKRWTREQHAEQLEQLLQRAGVAAHKLLSAVDMAEDAQLEHRGHYVALNREVRGAKTQKNAEGNAEGNTEESVVENTRMLLSRTPGSPSFSAPTFGRDNQKILSNILGYSQEKIDSLDASGILT